LSPEERIQALCKLQNRTLETLGDAEALMFRRYAAKTMDLCVERLTTQQQVEVLTDGARKALSRVDRNYLSEACAALINMARLQPRMIDPASFTARADDPRPVVVGPWLLEIGFELLYWLPYLRAELARLGVPKERVIAISRGGTDAWYSDIAGRHLDILDVMTPQEFHDWTSGQGQGDEIMQGNRKTFFAESFETTILDRVLTPTGIKDYQVIMPSAMYALMRNVWRGRFGSHGLKETLSHSLLPRPNRVALPFDGPYVAVKFYHSRTFPKTAALDAFVQDLVRRIARRSNIVVLSNAARLDDHDTLSLGTGDGAFQIFDASGLYTPRNNLAIQTALVAHAEELHGTYGGFSYLGPLLGVDTVAYTGTCDFTITHLDLAWTAFDQIGGGQLTMVPVREGGRGLGEEQETEPLTRRNLQREQNAYSV
jgi:hypothetical protein